jgi:hypothetical protein
VQSPALFSNAKRTLSKITQRDIESRLHYALHKQVFLDDLDGVAPNKKDACLQAINLFLREKWQHGAVICSSLSDRLQVRIGLSRAIALQPLTQKFICDYIQQTGNLSLWDNICNDRDLQNLVNTPLLLNILLLISDRFSLEQWRELQSAEERLDYLFEAYIAEMLARSYPKEDQYSDEENNIKSGNSTQK